MQLRIRFGAVGLATLERLELELLVRDLDMVGQALALRKGLSAARDDAHEGLDLGHGRVTRALVRLEVVELGICLVAARERAGEVAGGEGFAGSRVGVVVTHGEVARTSTREPWITHREGSGADQR